MLPNKVNNPALSQDRLPLPITVPLLPDGFIRKFPELREYNEAVKTDWRKKAGILREGVEVVGEVINAQKGDNSNIRVELDGLIAQIEDLGEALVENQQAIARRIITVSALAGRDSNIDVQSTPPLMPSVNDVWIDNSNPSIPIPKEWDGLVWQEITVPISVAAVSDEREARVTADGFLSGKYTLTVASGNVVTGMNITSASGPGGTISEVTFRADRFKIYNGTSGRIMFDVTGSQVRLGGVLVVDTPSQKVFIGGGTWANASTAWYVDYNGYFSLGDQLYWNPSTAILTIAGSIAATTGTIGGFDVGTNYIRDAANQFGLSSVVSVSDDVRFWAGSSFALRAGAPFRVYESGIVVASSGTIGGWTLSSTILSGSNIALGSGGIIAAGSGNDLVTISSVDPTYRIWVGNVTSGSAAFSVTKTGLLYATGATISGSITSTSGSIGGWAIGATSLSGGNVSMNSGGTIVVGTSNDVVILSASDSTYRIWVGNATSGSAAFAVTKAGALFATGATISGSITSTVGAIGGWTIGSTTLSGGNVVLSSAGNIVVGTSNDVVILSASDSTYRIWVGNATAGSAAFAVTKAGALYAVNANVSGTITSSSGTIGGFTIGSTTLSSTGTFSSLIDSNPSNPFIRIGTVVMRPGDLIVRSAAGGGGVILVQVTAASGSSSQVSLSDNALPGTPVTVTLEGFGGGSLSFSQSGAYVRIAGTIVLRRQYTGAMSTTADAIACLQWHGLAA